MVDANLMKKLAQAKQGAQQGPTDGAVSQLFVQLHELMGQISEKLNSAPPEIITDEDKQQWEQLTMGVDGFVQQNMASPAGQKASPYGEPVQLAGSVPMEAGANPNAQPMPDMG